jgi:hypothetical protein
MQKMQGQKPALEKTRNSKVTTVFFILIPFSKLKTKLLVFS